MRKKNGIIRAIFPNQVLRERKKLSSVSLMFFTISFLGWCMEVVFCSSGLYAFLQ